MCAPPVCGTVGGVDDGFTLLAASDAPLVLSGAGLSVAAGIPDFRGPDGLWTRDPAAESLSEISAYLGDPAVRARVWDRAASAPPRQPTPAHWAIAELATSRSTRIITQNTDGLHRATGLDEELIELHGSAATTRCRSCGARQSTAAVLGRVRAGETDPRCSRGTPPCGGILATEVVRFGENLDRALWRRAQSWVRASDLLVVVGSSLRVAPAHHLLELATRVVIVNQQPGPYDARADVVVRDDLQAVLVDWVSRLRA